MDDGALAYTTKAEAASTSKLKLADRVTYSVSTDPLTSMSSVHSFENRSKTDNSAVNVIRVQAKKSMLIT
jgi:hypothetical protein